MKLDKKPQKPGIGKLGLMTAKIVDGVEELIKKNLVKIEGNTLFIYPELLNNPDTNHLYIKNLYYYTRVKKLLHAGDILYIKNIESREMIAFFHNENVTII